MIKYEYRCPACGMRSDLSENSLLMFGEPTCRGSAEDRHKRTKMQRIYSVPTILWPKSERGH